MPAKFEVYKDKKGEFRFRLRTANGETIAVGEGYLSQADARMGIAWIKVKAPIVPIEDTTIGETDHKPPKFEIYKGKKGEFRFRLEAANGETIATGEDYPNKASCEKGIAFIQRNAPIAEIVETTLAAVHSRTQIKIGVDPWIKAYQPREEKPKNETTPKERKPKTEITPKQPGTPMEEAFISTLDKFAEFIHSNGKEILGQPDRFKSVFLDLSQNQYRAQAKVFSQFLASKYAHDMRNGNAIDTAMLRATANYFHEDSLIDKNACEMVVAACAWLMGLIDKKDFEAFT